MIWKLFNELKNSGRETKPIHLKTTQITLTDPIEVANHFNKYFPSISKSSHIRSANQATYTVPPVEKATNEFSIPYIAEIKVLEMIRKLDANKATDLDDIPAKRIKLPANDIGMHIIQICNLSIYTHKFPQAWKQEIVRPLYKKGSQEEKENSVQSQSYLS